MFQPKLVARFALFVVVVYAVLTWLWPMFDRGYAAWFRSVGNVAFARLWCWPQARVDFLNLYSSDLVADINAVLPGKLPAGFEPQKAMGVRDTLLVLTNNDVPAVPGMMRTSSRIMGYVPTAVLVALAVATPLSLRRRGWVLLWGLVLVHVFVIFRLTVLVVNNGFAAAKQYALFHPGPFWKDVLRRADEVLADNPTFSYVVPVFLWVLILFGLEMWKGRRERGPAAPAGKN